MARVRLCVCLCSPFDEETAAHTFARSSADDRFRLGGAATASSSFWVKFCTADAGLLGALIDRADKLGVLSSLKGPFASGWR